jgi:hypothetical protein
MPFVPMEIEQSRRAAPVRCRVFAEKNSREAYVFVIIRDDMLTTLGWKVGDRIRIFRGTGEDAARLMLRAVQPEDSQGVRLRKGSNNAKGATLKVKRAGELLKLFPPHVATTEMTVVKAEGSKLGVQTTGGEMIVQIPNVFRRPGEKGGEG